MPDVQYLDIPWAPYEDGSDQSPFFDDDTPDGRLLVTGGFGSGKSMVVIGKALKLSAINYPHPGIFVVPTYDHWDETIIETIKSCDKNGRRWFLEDDQFRVRRLRSGMKFEWAGGGDWIVRSGMTRIVGINAAWGGMDEPGLNAYKAYKDTIARIRHPGAALRQFFAGGTPEGLNWLAELWGEEASDKYHRYQLDTRKNEELMAAQPDYVQDILRNATEQEAAAYVGGHFSNLDGVLAYPTFARREHYQPNNPALEPDPRLPLRLTFDFNVDPMSAVVGQIVPGALGPTLHVVDAVIANNAWTPQVCEKIIERYGRQASTARFGLRGSRGWPGGAIVYGDSTGNARHASSNKNNFMWIKELLGPEFPTFKVHESVTRGNPLEKDRTDAVNVMFRNAAGHARLFIRKREPVETDPVYKLVRSLELTIKAPGTDHIHKPAGETHTHPSDALGYLVAAEFPVRRPTAQVGSSNMDI